jgi:hypothetical protein
MKYSCSHKTSKNSNFTTDHCEKEKPAQQQITVSERKSLFNKIDINSISVRKFNLDICEDPNNSNTNHQEHHYYSGQPNTRRVCLPIFA